MSVGHVARIFEERGIATVCVLIEAFEHYAREMRVPRTLVTPHPMGRPMGAPGDRARQEAVIRRALALVDDATEPVIVSMEGAYLS